MPYADAKALTRRFLAQAFPDATVVTSIPADLEAKCPVIVVGRTGGGIRDLVLDDADLDVTCFAIADSTDALVSAGDVVDALAEDVRAALLWNFVGFTALGGRVTQISETNAPRQIPYDNTNVRRSEASFRPTIRSTPTEGVPQ